MSRQRDKDFPRRDEKGRIKETCYTFTIYPDSKSYRYNELIKGIERDKGIKRYCYIMHGEDVNDDGEPLKPHTHMLVEFNNPRVLDTQARRWGLAPHDLTALPLNECPDLIQYFTHDTAKARAAHKHLYSKDDLVYKGYDIADIFSKDGLKDKDKARMIYEYINAAAYYVTHNELLQFCFENDLYSALQRSGWIMRGFLYEHNEKYPKRKLQTLCRDDVVGIPRDYTPDVS